VKLLNCLECNDVVALYIKPRTCLCGKSSGQYLNTSDATVTGPCRIIGIRNDQYKVSIILDDPSKDFVWFQIGKQLK
jgi:hypothetical protein